MIQGAVNLVKTASTKSKALVGDVAYSAVEGWRAGGKALKSAGGKTLAAGVLLSGIIGLGVLASNSRKSRQMLPEDDLGAMPLPMPMMAAPEMDGPVDGMAPDKWRSMVGGGRNGRPVAQNPHMSVVSDDAVTDLRSPAP